MTLSGAVPIPGLKLSSGIDPAGFNLDLISVKDELSAQTEWFPLQGEVDEIHGFTNLLLVVAVGNLVSDLYIPGSLGSFSVRFGSVAFR